MISEPALRRAIESGVLTPEQVQKLEALAREDAQRNFEPLADQEKLRFISGFGDLFVVIGVALFLGAAAYFLWNHTAPFFFWAGLAALSWGLAELFSHRLRMAFPSIVLLVLYAGFALMTLYTGLRGLSGKGWSEPTLFLGFDEAGLIALAALLTCAAVGLHYWRFRVPITVAAGIGSLALAAYAFLFALAPNLVLKLGGWIILAIGLGIFALAMRYDRSDLRRETRRTDIAFWLHLLAAPLVVHSFMLIAFGGLAEVTLAKASGLLIVFAAFSVLALLIDRRAILVSALVYAGAAFGTVFRETALANAALPATLLVLGAFILALSAGWQTLRRLTLPRVPERIRAALPVLSEPSKR